MRCKLKILNMQFGDINSQFWDKYWDERFTVTYSIKQIVSLQYLTQHKYLMNSYFCKTGIYLDIYQTNLYWNLQNCFRFICLTFQKGYFKEKHRSCPSVEVLVWDSPALSTGGRQSCRKSLAFWSTAASTGAYLTSFFSRPSICAMNLSLRGSSCSHAQVICVSLQLRNQQPVY